jgi:hypothetical protein
MIWLYIGGKYIRRSEMGKQRKMREAASVLAQALNVRPNGEAQPPAEGYGVLKRYNGRHETDSQKRPSSAGRLERNVGPPSMLMASAIAIRDQGPRTGGCPASALSSSGVGADSPHAACQAFRELGRMRYWTAGR